MIEKGIKNELDGPEPAKKANPLTDFLARLSEIKVEAASRDSDSDDESLISGRSERKAS